MEFSFTACALHLSTVIGSVTLKRRRLLRSYSNVFLATTVVGACAPPSNGDDSSCFRLDQLVATPRGPVAIGRLSVGDTIWSIEPRTGAREPQSIARVIDAFSDTLLRLQFSDRVIEAVTGMHPLFDTVRQQWVRAADLSAGAQLACDNRSTRTLIAVTPFGTRNSTPVRTLTMAGPIPTFLVSGVVVHNKWQAEYVDVDGDGYNGAMGEGGSPDDCNDNDPDINPDAPEDCTNKVDDDCDGLVDEEDPDCQDTGGR